MAAKEKKTETDKAPDSDHNMALWNSVRTPDPNEVKKVTEGRKFSTTCAQYLKMRATELWGSMGGAWGLTDERFEIVMNTVDEHNSILVYHGKLFYPGDDGMAFSIGAHSSMSFWMYVRSRSEWKLDDEAYKKVRTNALSKALSELGFAADIYMGKFDDDKYVSQAKAAHAGDEKITPANKEGKTKPKPAPAAKPATDPAPVSTPATASSPTAPPKCVALVLGSPVHATSLKVYMAMHNKTKAQVKDKFKQVWEACNHDEAVYLDAVMKLISVKVEHPKPRPAPEPLPTVTIGEDRKPTVVEVEDDNLPF